MNWRPDRSAGIASIMDAFMFMMAVIALGSFFLATQVSDDAAEDEDFLKTVDRAHVVLLSTTLEVPCDGSQEGVPPLVEVVSLVQASGGEGKMDMPGWARTQVVRIISELLGPGWGFEWQVMCEDRTSSLAILGGPSGESQVFASSIHCDGGDEQAMAFVLKAWRVDSTSAC